jgi:hypothetical protein
MKRKSGMANRLHLESAGRLAGEAYSGGVLYGLRIINQFDHLPQEPEKSQHFTNGNGRPGHRLVETAGTRCIQEWHAAVLLSATM